MKMKTKSYFYHFSLLTGLLLLAFVIHYFQIKKNDQLILAACYAFNWIWTIGFLAVVYLGSEKQVRQLGFIFLYLSLAKFGLFLFLIKPQLHLDNGIRSEHFAFFFIPYAIAMVYETISTLRTLNGQ